MLEVPHDTADVLLAPVALQLDQQLQQLSGLNEEEITLLVALSTDLEPYSPERRRALLLTSLTRDIETHGWRVAWHERGLQLSHAGRHIVLGHPTSVRAFVQDG